MLIRRLVALALLGTLGVVTPAHAVAPKKSCKMLKDVTGDTGPFGNAAGSTAGTTPAPLTDASLDIVGADVVASTGLLTAVLRVKSLGETKGKLSKTGRSWSINFQVNGKSAGLVAYRTPLGGDDFALGRGTFDLAHNEIRISEPWSMLLPGTKITRTSVITGLYASSDVVVGFPAGQPPFAPVYGNYDNASTKITYTVGTASCVKLGA